MAKQYNRSCHNQQGPVWSSVFTFGHKIVRESHKHLQVDSEHIN